MSEGKTTSQTKVDGVVVGLVISIDSSGNPLVAFVGNSSDMPVAAKSTVVVDAGSIGREVALLFEGGDINKPIIIGLMHQAESEVTHSITELETPDERSVEEKIVMMEEASELVVDGQRVQLNAKEQIVLKCGKSSITLTRAGKVIIRGTYISTKSSGVNRIKGGSVQIN